MKVSKEDFQWFASQGFISPEQSLSLWQALEERYKDKPNLGLFNVLYYFGALLVISAMTWFMTLGWETFGGFGIFFISVAYMLFFILLGKTLWCKYELKIPGGLLFTIAVCVTPLAIYGLEKGLGFWPQASASSYQDYHVWVKGTWLIMELGTILAGLITLKYIRFPFLTAPIAYTLWYLSMDFTPLLFGQNEYTWEQREWVSMVFGAIMLVIGYIVDRRTKEDFSFWLYLFGLLSFWISLLMIVSGKSEEWQLLWCLYNLSLILSSVLFGRKLFMVFGTFGVMGYLSHISYAFFNTSIMFPFVLSCIGVMVIVLGILYQKNQERIDNWVLSLIPEDLQRFLPRTR